MILSVDMYFVHTVHRMVNGQWCVYYTTANSLWLAKDDVGRAHDTQASFRS